MKKYKVLVVEDSLMLRKMITDLINSHSEFEVVGTASNGQEGVNLFLELKPDIVTMDLEMPIMDGLQALELIMKHKPTPVLMLSSLYDAAVSETLKALKLGAIDFVIKNDLLKNDSDSQEDFFQKMKGSVLAEIKNIQIIQEVEEDEEENVEVEVIEEKQQEVEIIKETQQEIQVIEEKQQNVAIPAKIPKPFHKQEVKPINKEKLPDQIVSSDKKIENKLDFIIQKPKPIPIILQNDKVIKTTIEPKTKPYIENFDKRNHNIDLIVIGTSTGGPNALHHILTQLPSNLPVPIIVAQHMPKGFTKSLADRLNQFCHMKVKEAQNHDILEKGTIYIAPAGFQTLIQGKTIKIEDGLNYNERFQPSVNITVSSASENYKHKLLTVILTGMGNDGLEGCKLVKKNKGIVFTQSQNSCVVYGMPRCRICDSNCSILCK
jgi:two-component system chemotaxis response regulator CheB